MKIKEQFINRWSQLAQSNYGGNAELAIKRELDKVINEAIAEHEAEAWRKYPDEKPDQVGDRCIVFTNEDWITLSLYFPGDWNRVIAWRELPSPYQPEKGVNQ